MGNVLTASRVAEVSGVTGINVGASSAWVRPLDQGKACKDNERFINDPCRSQQNELAVYYGIVGRLAM